MALINPQIPTIGQPNSTEDQDVANALTTIVATINGGLDTANLAAAAGITGAQLAAATVTSAKLAASSKLTLSTVAATASQTGSGAWADITGVSIAITPTVPVYYVALLSSPVRHAAAGGQQATLGVNVDGSRVKEASVAVVASLDMSGTVVAGGTLTAAAHTIKGEVNATTNLTFPATSHLLVVTFPQ